MGRQNHARAPLRDSGAASGTFSDGEPFFNVVFQAVRDCDSFIPKASSLIGSSLVLIAGRALRDIVGPRPGDDDHDRAPGERVKFGLLQRALPWLCGLSAAGTSPPLQARRRCPAWPQGG